MYTLIFPYLLCTLPAHSVFAQNSTEISLQDYICSLIILCIIITGGILGLDLFLHNLYLSELIFSANFFLLLYANIFFNILLSPYKATLPRYKILFVLSYLFICAAISSGIIIFTKLISPEYCAKILFLISAFISFFVYIDCIKRIFEYNNHPPDTGKTDFPHNHIKSVSAFPDIYHIIADSHTGFDREWYCDDTFKDELIKRGFHIYQKATSNYNMTHHSVPSLLNMDYIENITQNSNALKYYGNNRVFSFLKNTGYNIHASTFNLYQHLLNNNKIKFRLNLLKVLLFSSVIHIIKTAKHKSNLKEIKKQIIETAQIKNNKPKYFFGHLLAPHCPYLYNENGIKLPQYEIWNLKNYFTYQKYINKELIKIIDELKGNMNPNSIIILHGDHSITGDVENKFKILLSIYFPPGYNPRCIADNCTLVNLFRSLFNEVFKTKYPLLENKHLSVSRKNTIISGEKNFKEIMVKNNFEKRFNKLKKKYASKRILLYGTGDFFKAIQQEYDLSEFNIAGISDLKYRDYTEPQKDINTGYTIISPEYIYKLKPDIVIITALESIYIEQYFNTELFKNKKNRFKYDILFKPNSKFQIEQLFSRIL